MNLFDDMQDEKETAYIGLGSNLGRRREILNGAIDALGRNDAIEVMTVSEFVETDPVGGPPQGKFLNGVVAISTSLEPRELLATLQKIEEEFGRRRGVRWGPRTLDLDILIYGRRRINTSDLKVPHPRMHERRFVLEPLSQIAPDLVHPVLEQSVSELLAEL
jgi:2-amino-4-hydroxy-6-hydroxymethyldihydropteridine diphosphokinase